jgi:hypothetical protein
MRSVILCNAPAYSDALVPSVVQFALCTIPYNSCSLWQAAQNHDDQGKRATSLTKTANESDRRVSCSTNMTPCLGGGFHFTSRYVPRGGAWWWLPVEQRPLRDERGDFYPNRCSTFFSKTLPGERLPRFGVPFSRYSHGRLRSGCVLVQR